MVFFAMNISHDDGDADGGDDADDHDNEETLHCVLNSSSDEPTWTMLVTFLASRIGIVIMRSRGRADSSVS
jgi:hypothetical protein